MRTRYLFLLLALFSVLVARGSGAADAGPAPLILRPEPLPGRFTGLVESRHAWLVQFGGWSEWGGARPNALRLDGHWHRVPSGSVFSWRTWLVFEGLEPLARREEEEEGDAPTRLPPGATLGFSLGTDDAFARRVVLLDRQTKRRMEAPWDTLAPLPLGDGQVWLLWRCRGDDVTRNLELLAWTPRDGRSRSLGQLVGEVRGSCEQASAASELRVLTYPDGGVKTPQGTSSYEWVPAVVPSGTGAFAWTVSDGGAAWVFVDAKGRVHDRGPPGSMDGGTPLQPFTRVPPEEAYDVPMGSLRTRDGREVFGAFADGGPIPLTPSMGAGFALYQGFLFTDEGVFRWPRGEPPPRVVPVSEEGHGSDGGTDAPGTP